MEGWGGVCRPHMPAGWGGGEDTEPCTPRSARFLYMGALFWYFALFGTSVLYFCSFCFLNCY